MAIEAELILDPTAVASIKILKAERSVAGRWKLEVSIAARVRVDEDRDVVVENKLVTVTGYQRGRRPNPSAFKRKGGGIESVLKKPRGGHDPKLRKSIERDGAHIAPILESDDG
jgi:hypothetical protein